MNGLTCTGETPVTRLRTCVTGVPPVQVNPMSVERSLVRYVVLHHTRVALPHFDLMIEPAAGARLWTWRCGEWPLRKNSFIERVADHRGDYLAYEGPVSHDRGEVHRVAAGNCEAISANESGMLVSLDGVERFLPGLHAPDGA